MKPFRLSRRFFLRGAGGLGVALPLLDVMDPIVGAAAQGTAPPKRFIAFYEQSGVIYSRWKPTGTLNDFTLSPTLAPLEPFKAKLLVIDGLTNSAGTKGPGDDHSKGMGTMLTGTELVGGTNDLAAGGISLDQEIANRLAAGTKFKSLELGVQSGTGHITNYMSHAAARQPLPAVADPAQIYSRLFGSFTPPVTGGGPAMPDPAAVRLVAQRRSVLDAVKESYSSVLPRVSTADRAKLEAHLQSIREIERGLVADPSSTPPPTTTASACAKPAAPTINTRSNDNFPAIGKLQIDLLVMAMACDLTRVACLQFSRESADPVFTWLNLGMSRGHHAISHDADSNQTSQNQLAAIDKWHAEQLAYLASKMDGIAEGSGTMLDNSLVMWVNGLAKGNVHSHGATPPQPLLTLGSAGGAIRTGRYLVTPRGATTNEAYLAALNAFGIPATTFGNPAYCKGPLAGFLG